jgi:hypothetical protein
MTTDGAGRGRRRRPRLHFGAYLLKDTRFSSCRNPRKIAPFAGRSAQKLYKIITPPAAAISRGVCNVESCGRCHSEEGASSMVFACTKACAPTEESAGWAHDPAGYDWPLAREAPPVPERDSSVGAQADAHCRRLGVGAFLRMTGIVYIHCFPAANSSLSQADRHVTDQIRRCGSSLRLWNLVRARGRPHLPPRADTAPRRERTSAASPIRSSIAPFRPWNFDARGPS